VQQIFDQRRPVRLFLALDGAFQGRRLHSRGLQHRGGEAGQMGDMDAVALGREADDHLVQKHDPTTVSASTSTIIIIILG